jgi:predicted oxidoreductase
VLAATLSHPAIHCAVIGVKDGDQVREAAGATDKSIDRPDYFKIRQMLNFAAPAKIKDAGGKVK